MNTTTSRNKVLIINHDIGVERDELVVPRDRLREAGFQVTVASDSGEAIQTMVGDTEKDAVVEVDAKIGDANADDHALLVIPGGTVNADQLRGNDDALAVVRAFAKAGKPIASICHGPWILINAGIAKDKNLTSYHSVRLDLENAGANWEDDVVVTCNTGDWPLITSRDPDDLDAFCKTLIDTLSR